VRLTRRLLLASLVVTGVVVALVIALANRRSEERTRGVLGEELAREARLIAWAWTPRLSPDSLADVAGASLGHRVTLIDAHGQPVGDSEFDPPALGRLESFASRPEVAAALTGAEGVAHPRQPSPEDPSLAVAVRARDGVVLLTANATSPRRREGAAGPFLLFGLIATALVFLGLGVYVTRTVSRPIVELGDVARGLAAGDLGRRPSLSAPGEIGDLAIALHRMAEQLAARLAALEADEALMTALFESLSEGVVATNRRGQVVRVNDTARRLLGTNAPTPFSAELLSREPALREALKAALEGQASEPIEMRVGELTVALTARPLPAGGAVLAVFDLTALRRLEIIRRDFVANVSHELKTPLTVINGFAETLVDDDPPAEHRRRFAETIRANARRMQRIVDDLLDLSRIESGGWVPNPSFVDVRAVAADAITAVGDGTPDGVTLSASIADGADRAYVDPTAVRQVLGNLVENALRHTQRGAVTIFAERKEGGIWIGVRDTGVGIAAEHLPRIFERFYRVDPGRSRELGGTGLGLAIVRHLAEAHGGRVRAESAVSQGTTIAAFFPDPP
jgi:two-component system, OmpR family, phosphate regulon sensor histidine kinase PhoR